MKLNMSAAIHTAAWRLRRVEVSVCCSAPRKKSSSDRPAIIPTISIETINDPMVSLPMINDVADAALSSMVRKACSISPMLSGRCRPAFHAMIYSIAGMATIMVAIINNVGASRGQRSIASIVAGRRVASTAVIRAGTMNRNSAWKNMRSLMDIMASLTRGIIRPETSEKMHIKKKNVPKRMARAAPGRWIFGRE